MLHNHVKDRNRNNNHKNSHTSGNAECITSGATRMSCWKEMTLWPINDIKINIWQRVRGRGGGGRVSEWERERENLSIAWIDYQKAFNSIPHSCIKNWTVAGQPEFEPNNCHPQMKIKTISIILCDNYFCSNGTLKFYVNQFNRSWKLHFVFYNYVNLISVSVPLKRHELKWQLKLLVHKSLSFLNRNHNWKKG